MIAPKLTLVALLLGALFIDQINAYPRPNKSGPRRSHRIKSTKYSREVESKMRLGANKQGIANAWSIASRAEVSHLRNPSPVNYVAPKSQLTGRMGDGSRPRARKKSNKSPAAPYVAPHRRFLDLPQGLTEMTEAKRDAVANEFWMKYNYTSNHQLADKEDLVTAMQTSYGLPVTGILDDATVTAMLAPRCGVPDGPAKYSTFANREHWQSKDVTYHIKGYTPDMSQCQTRNAFKRAFRVWEEVTDLTFAESTTDDADIIIYFGYEEHGDGYAFDGANGLLAHAFTPGLEAISGDSHFDEGEFWTLGQGRVFDTYNGNDGGKPCSLPFYFEGVSYTTCTAAGRSDGIEWCSTTPDYDKDGKWAFCPSEKLFTYGGNAESDPCKFPFIFLEESYDSCTTYGRNDGYEWCATTSSYDIDGKWGFCPKRAHGTSDGNSGGASCKFPFKFQSYSYSECTTQGRNDYKLWCATTDDYDRDGMWGFCDGDGYSLFLVAAHEFGHAIGLDHSNVPGALMYPVYSYKYDFVLPLDDTRGAQDLYDGPRRKYLPPLQLEECGGNLKESETGTSSTTPSTTTRRRTTTPTRRTPTTRPQPASCYAPALDSVCDGKIDAVMLIQDQTYVFQGAHYWIYSGRGKSLTKVVRPIAEKWPVLDCNIDGAYQRPSDEKLVFFKGDRYYVYDGTRLEPGYPRNLTELGLPAKTAIDDVVYMYSKNRRNTGQERTYYFVGDLVYRADINTGIVMRDHRPTVLGSTQVWKDLPTDLDAVYVQTIGKPYTIFVKGDRTYRFENIPGMVTLEKKVSKVFKCPPRRDTWNPLPLTDRN